MTNRAPDQAEKLRQLAAQDPEAPGTALLDPPASSPSEALSESDETTSARAIVAPEPAAPEPAAPVNAREETSAPSSPNEEKKSGKEESPKPEQSVVAKTTEPSVPSAPKPVETPKQNSPAAPKAKTAPVLQSTSIPRRKLNLGAKHTRVIAISGGKGGVGKSNVACNLGIAMSSMGKNVLLFDADLSLANVDVLLGLTPRLNLSHVISGEKKLNEILVDGPAGLRLLPGGSGIEELSELNESQMETLFAGLESIDPSPDVLLIDTAAGIHPNVLQFVLAADQTVVVTTPEPTAYTDAYALIKTMVKHKAGDDISVLVNMARDSREATEVVKLLLQICRQMLNISFNNMGYIPRDNEVLTSVRHQNPFILRAPECTAAKAIRNMASSLLQIKADERNSRGLRGFFQSLFQRRQSVTGKSK